MKFSSKECKDSKAQKGKRVSGGRVEGGSEGKRKNLLPAHSVNYIILSCDFGQRVAVFLLFFLLHSNEQPHKSQLGRKSSKDPQCKRASVLV